MLNSRTEEIFVILRLMASRLLLSVGTLFLVSIMVFTIIEILPGDAATRILGRDATPETLALFRERMGLNDPAIVRYLHWLSGALQGNFGEFLAGKRPVIDIILPALKNTLLLSGAAIVLYLPLSFFIGITTAFYHHKFIDNLLSGLALLGMSMPEFVIGTLLVVAFAVELRWLPALSMLSGGEPIFNSAKKLVLPVLTLTAEMLAYGARMLRDRLIEIFEAEFVQMATLRGLSRWRVIFRHALPSAVLPFLNVTSINIAWLVGGVVVVETVFTYPGIGRLFVDALGNLDYPLVEALTLIMAFVYVIVNLGVDIAAILLDPRLRNR